MTSSWLGAASYNVLRQTVSKNSHLVLAINAIPMEDLHDYAFVRPQRILPRPLMVPKSVP